MILRQRAIARFYPLLRHCLSAGLLFTLVLASGCRSLPGTLAARSGDEMVVAGQFFHTGTPVVLWLDPGGYDGYRVERRFSPLDKADWLTSHGEDKSLETPNRYTLRRDTLTPEQLEKVRGGGWDLPLLQSVVDQFVIHYDVAGTSRQCFNILHDHRDISVHFMLDLDGTIYQTLDLKERARHAGSSNNRSVGIEIANMGAYGPEQPNPFADWYQHNKGVTTLTIPKRFGDGGVRTKGFVGHPARPTPVKGTIQGDDLIQYDFTPQQYEALSRLTAALCKVFPRLKCDYPRDATGRLIPHILAESELEKYQGVLGHYHLQANKVDPGPAFQWERVIGQAQKLLQNSARGHGRDGN
ncbi:MAG: negative regulator of beta-lactamase expression [Pedosphaera sp.]|nr:negative regulator of beta-lactamase expression [Pedosphaera sp.]